MRTRITPTRAHGVRLLPAARPWLATLLIAVGLSLSAGVLTGCGDDNALVERPVDPRKNRPKPPGAGAEAADPAGTVVIPLRNPKWDAIEQHFKKYLAQKHTTPKDIYKTTVLKFIPRPAVKEKEEEVETVEIEKEELGPLQQFSLKQYSLGLIMSGTAVPKAVVVDPKGQAFVIQRDTRIGDKGGIVDAITQYMVVVKEPNREEPHKLTIKPPYVDLATQGDFEPEDYEMSADDFAAPAAVRRPTEAP